MNDDFEKRLQKITPREIPSAWREEILASARRDDASSPASRATMPEFLRRFVHQVSTFVPLPRTVWTGVAVAWMMILVLNFSGGPEATTSAAVTSIDQTRLALKQKHLLLSELAGRTEVTAQPPPPGPRSQRREEASVS